MGIDTGQLDWHIAPMQDNFSWQDCKQRRIQRLAFTFPSGRKMPGQISGTAKLADAQDRVSKKT